MLKRFVNRKEECNDLSSKLDFDKKPRITFILGISGIGKSAFTKKVLEKRENIRLQINDLIGVVEQGAYIQELAATINNYYLSLNTNEFSFPYFFNNSLDSYLKKRNLSIIGESTTGVLPYGIGKLLFTALKLIFKFKEYNYNEFFNSGNNDILQTLRAYIEYILRKNRLIIVIENFQKIDFSSYNLLKDIISKSSYTNFIFEYTTNESFSRSKFEEIHSNSFLNSDLYSINLAKMNLSEYLKMYPDSIVASTLMNSFIEFDGNIRKLEDGDLLFNLNHQNIIPLNSLVNDFNYTKTHIDSLENQLKVVLTAITVHRLSVTIESLKNYLDSEIFKDLWIDLDSSLKRLIEHELIKIEKEHVSIKHDFISKEVLSNNLFNRFILPSYKIWIEYYQKKLYEKDFSFFSKNKIYHLLFNFYFASNDFNNLFKLLPEIKRVTLESTYPNSAVEYIESLRNNEKNLISNKVQDSINFALIDIYYALGLFDKAWSLLLEIKNESKRHIAYKAALLDRLDRHNEAIIYIKKHLVSELDKRLELILKLILMISYRSSNNYLECERIYLEMMENIEFEKYDEYGFLLRNSEIILPISNSIKELKKSITFFKGKGLLVEMGQSFLTLSLLNVWNNDYKSALSNLNKAEELLYNETFERHIFFNNRAVICMYQNDFSEQVENLLSEARKTIMCSFDKLTIHINHIIYFTILNRNKDSFKTCDDIINSTLNLIENQPDKVMHRLAYYTIAQYYKSQNIDLFHLYMKKSYEIHLILTFRKNNYWEERFSYYKSNYSTKDNIMTYDLGLISYWHFKIPEDI